jgi:RNA polymerase sigma-70 factor, ECF subfamily
VTATTEQIARLLREGEGGNQEKVDQLVQVLYGELRRLAASFLRRERTGHTLQPTALVNEAYLRLVEQDGTDWKNRSHFIALAAQAMRRVLIDHARRSQAAKRGGPLPRLSLEQAIVYSKEQAGDLLALDELMQRLARLDPRQARIVELRVFGGLTVEEAAEALGISAATVKRNWAMAKAWLSREMDRGQIQELN